MKQKKEKSKNDIIMGADPFGIALKDAVKSALLEDGFNVIDITGKRKQNYFDAAQEVGSAVSDGKCAFGFLFLRIGRSYHRFSYCRIRSLRPAGFSRT